MKLIQSTHLTQWADQKEAERLFPLLLRKLIIASCKEYPAIDLPAGDSIYKPGVDGHCETTVGGLYVPTGSSFWELGRNEDFKSKYRQDFNKRSSNVADSEQQHTTFIFVTLRRWVKSPTKQVQIRQDQAAGKWKAVRILDADDLETWLEQCPQVASWLCIQLNIPIEGVEAVEGYWQRIINNNKLAISPELIIAGRLTQQEQIIGFINKGSGILEIQGTSREETVAFIIAAYIIKGTQQKDYLFSKAVIINDARSLKSMCTVQQDLIIIYDSGDDTQIESMELNGSKVLYPVSFKIRSSGLALPIPTTNDYIKQLENLGIGHRRAYRMARECGKSFPVLRRILSNQPGRVSWALSNDPTVLIPLFFIQRFDSTKSGDRKIVELLSGLDFDAYIERLKQWTLVFDKPVNQVANIWQVTSPYDLLFAVGKYMSEEHIKRMRGAFFLVMGETDPALELEPRKRYAAAIYNKLSIYSGGLKSGFCNSLILLNLFATNAGIQLSFSLKEYVESMIGDLLNNKDIKFWQTIQNYLNILAEAAPNIYLEALEKLIKDQPHILAELFDDQDFDLFTPTYHTHILWSLEALAWDKTNLSRVALILGKLALIDKGTKTANRPINSLKYIFSLWLPQTYSVANDRMRILQTLIRKNSTTAFQLLLELVPGRHNIGQYNYQPLWRLREYYPLKVSATELIEGTIVLARLIASAAVDFSDRWAKIVDYLDDLHGESRQILLQRFEEIDEFAGSSNGLRQELHDFISRHRTYADKDWAVPEEDRKVLERIYKKLTAKAVDRYAWLFNTDHLTSKRAERLPYDQQLEQLNAKRKTAVSEILKESGIHSLTALAEQVTYPGTIGHTLAELSEHHVDLAVKLLFSDNKKLKLFAMVYLNQTGILKDDDWVLSCCKEYEHLPLVEQGILWTAFSPSDEIWNQIEKDKNIADIYWSELFKQFSPRISDINLDRCIRSLNIYQRFVTSLNMIEYRHKHLPAQLIYDTLDGLATQPVEAGIKLNANSYDFNKMFKRLDESDNLNGNMALLEWKYFDVLRADDENDRKIKYIFPALTEHPKFFAQVISWIYIPENSSPKSELITIDETSLLNRARQAYNVLQDWNEVPGEGSVGKIDFAKFKEWALAVIDECREFDRVNKAYYKIGEMLGKLRDSHGDWPQPELCELIELLDNESTNDGFVIGILNGRGPMVRINPVTDGSVELTRSNYYESVAEKLSFEYPTVGKLLLRVARDYEHSGNRMKIEQAQSELE